MPNIDFDTLELLRYILSLSNAEIKKRCDTRCLSKEGSRKDLIPRLLLSMCIASGDFGSKGISGDALLSSDSSSSSSDDSLLRNEDLLLSEPSIVPLKTTKRAASKRVPALPKATSTIAGTVGQATSPKNSVLAPKQTSPLSTMKGVKRRRYTI